MPGHLLITQRSEQPMPEPLNVYLDQMLRLDVGQALCGEGHNVIRASEVGQARADDYEILQKAIAEKTFTAESAENAEGFILKQRATTTKSFHRRGRRGSDFKRLKTTNKGQNKGGQAFLIVVIGENILTQRRKGANVKNRRREAGK